VPWIFRRLDRDFGFGGSWSDRREYAGGKAIASDPQVSRNVICKAIRALRVLSIVFPDPNKRLQ
jgi:hypothetical protein